MLVGYSSRPLGSHARPLSDQMRVNDNLRKCVVFIGYVLDDKFTAAGTGFMLMTQTMGHDFSHVVTARHNLEEIEEKYAKAKKPVAERQVWLRVNKTGGGAEFVETKQDEWFVKDVKGTYLDVAVLPVHEIPIDGAKLDVSNLMMDMFVEDEVAESIDLMAGAPVVTIGLFSTHWGETHNLPIVRNGHIALLRDPKNPVETKRGFMDAHLIEIRSLGGISGSPVFVPTEPYWVSGNQVKACKGIKKSSYFLGLIHGHFILRNAENDAVDAFSAVDDSKNPDEKLSLDELNSGIAVVVPFDKIMEVVDCEKLKNKRISIVEKKRAASAVREDVSGAKTKSVPVSGDRDRFNRLLGAAVKLPKSSGQT